VTVGAGATAVATGPKTFNPDLAQAGKPAVAT